MEDGHFFAQLKDQTQPEGPCLPTSYQEGDLKFNQGIWKNAFLLRPHSLKKNVIVTVHKAVTLIFFVYLIILGFESTGEGVQFLLKFLFLEKQEPTECDKPQTRVCNYKLTALSKSKSSSVIS